MKTLPVLGAAAAAIASLALLAGCSGGSGASFPNATMAADGRVDAPGEAGAEPAPAEQPAGVPGITVEQKIARTALVRITVTDVEAAAAQLRQLARAMDGQVTAENLVTRATADDERGPVSTIVITVPSDRLDSTLDQLKSVGTLTSRVVSSEDVSLEVADVDARIRTLNDSIARLRELWKRADRTSDLIQLEGETQARISERDSLVAQQRVLAARVATSPVTITLETPEKASEIETTGFLGGLMAGWNALVSSSRVLMTVVGAVLPFAALAALIVVPLLAWRRRARRPVVVHAPAPASAPPASDPVGDASAAQDATSPAPDAGADTDRTTP